MAFKCDVGDGPSMRWNEDRGAAWGSLAPGRGRPPHPPPPAGLPRSAFSPSLRLSGSLSASLVRSGAFRRLRRAAPEPRAAAMRLALLACLAPLADAWLQRPPLRMVDGNNRFVPASVPRDGGRGGTFGPGAPGGAAGDGKRLVLFDDEDVGEEEDAAGAARVNDLLLRERAQRLEAEVVDVPEYLDDDLFEDVDEDDLSGEAAARTTMKSRNVAGSDEALLFDNEMLVSREEGWLGDSTLEEIADDYGFPIDFMMESLASWGVPPPIQPSARLGELVTADQAYALLEALNSLDRSDVHDNYVQETLEELAEGFDASIAEVFQVAAQLRLNLPKGLDTRLSVADFRSVCRTLGWDVPEQYRE